MHSRAHSQDSAFALFAAHNHPPRHGIISVRQAGTFYLWIYLVVADPSIKPISGKGVRLAPRSSLPLLRYILSSDILFSAYITRKLESFARLLYLTSIPRAGILRNLVPKRK